MNCLVLLKLADYNAATGSTGNPREQLSEQRSNKWERVLS